ncbi:MAG: hypothetical protein H6751_04055 [Candidatus Omnitrophica bacterium]|nr:hypothetical protein [Candidatus Omnitrophota bacterium]
MLSPVYSRALFCLFVSVLVLSSPLTSTYCKDVSGPLSPEETLKNLVIPGISK